MIERNSRGIIVTERSGMDKNIRMIEGSDGKGEGRGRSGSCGSIKEMWKRKREESKDELEEEEREAFRRRERLGRRKR